MSEESVNHPTSEWEGQEQMGVRLVREATMLSPVLTQPIDDRILLYPVMPDEEQPVDLTVIRHGKDLPEMGIVCGVGWRVNKEAIEELRHIANRQRPTQLELAMKQAIETADIISVGDVVAFNKFSGMDVEGSNFVICSRLDVVCQLRNLPVRLRTEQERWDIVDEARREGFVQEAAPKLATPHGEIVKARR